MQHARTGYQPMVSGARWLQTAVRRGAGVGVLAGLLLLPLHVGAVGSGDLDTSFSGDGKVVTDFGSNIGDYAGAGALAIQSDGKIVVAGTAGEGSSGNSDFALARYLPNGTLDATFGGDGTVRIDFGSGSSDGAGPLAIQADGKIVVAGSSDASGNDDFALARYRPNGTLDATFSGDGKVLTDFGNGANDGASAVALQPDGKIVVAGSSNASGNDDFALARYRPNGTLDATFSGDGKVLTDFGGGSDDGASAVALQPDGKIVVAGWSNASGIWAFALARYLPNGTLDATFGEDGMVLTNSDDMAFALALQPDGKIVVLGNIALARYLPNGTLDATFGGDGTVTTSFDSRALALQPNGKIVVAGWSYSPATGNYGFALARYLPNGTLDTSFSGDGRVRTDFANASYDFAHALVIQPRDGRLVVAGSSTASDHEAFALARYHAITCNGVVATRVGTAGNDTLMGTAGPDVIVGFDGNDTIYGLGGNDILCGNTGHDTLDGGSGNDLLEGDIGNDTLVGGTGDDILHGDAGTDVCDGGAHVSGDTASGCEQVTSVP